MSEITGVAASPQTESQTGAGRFDRVSILLHWITVFLVVEQFTTAWLLSPHNPSAVLSAVHRSGGVSTWIVAILRLAWRNRFAYLPPFPAGMPKLQQRIAKLNEYALYALLLLQPASGLGATLSRGKPFQLFVWNIPAILTPDDARARAFFSVHEFGASMLLVLIGLHAAAALAHGLFMRDGVLQRMLPDIPR